ncbi:MAG: histidine phosphatase family protein, partial [SAR86 cluster bacterium]
MTETTIYLVRHGQIDANVDRRWFGSTDSNLNAQGLQQADRLTALFQEQYPAITASYSSPLKRTMRTAKGVTGDFFGPASAHPGLREYAIG